MSIATQKVPPQVAKARILAAAWDSRLLLGRLDEVLASGALFVDSEMERASYRFYLEPNLKLVLQEAAKRENLTFVDFIKKALVEKVTRDCTARMEAGEAAEKEAASQ